MKSNQEKNEKYWLDRAIQQDKKIQKDLKKVEKQLKKLYVEVSKEIKKELTYFYANKTDITEYEKYHLESTLKALNTSLDTLFNNEEEILNKTLIQVYTEIFQDTLDSLEIETSFNTINDNFVREVIKTNWSGFTFSETIWEKHLPQLKNDVKQIFKQGLIRGDSLNDMAKALNDKLNKGYSNAKRLVHTETCWIQNQATINGYKEAEVKEYVFMAFLDSKTSKACIDMDGEVIKLEDAKAGVNLPPLHPY